MRIPSRALSRPAGPGRRWLDSPGSSSRRPEETPLVAEAGRPSRPGDHPHAHHARPPAKRAWPQAASGTVAFGRLSRVLTRHRLASLDGSTETDPRKLPIWTGASGKSRETRETWEMREASRLAVSGYAGGRGLYPPPQGAYTTSPIPVDDSTDEVRPAYGEHAREIRSQWFRLAQGTRGSASMVVERVKRNGHPSGRDAWLQL